MLNGADDKKLYLKILFCIGGTFEQMSLRARASSHREVVESK